MGCERLDLGIWGGRGMVATPHAVQRLDAKLQNLGVYDAGTYDNGPLI